MPTSFVVNDGWSRCVRTSLLSELEILHTQNEIGILKLLCFILQYDNYLGPKIIVNNLCFYYYLTQNRSLCSTYRQAQFSLPTWQCPAVVKAFAGLPGKGS
jgi:hypothetical protein